MRNLTSFHPVLRFLGVIGLFLVLISNRAEAPSVFISAQYRPFIVIVSAILIGLGLFIKLKYDDEKPSKVTYISSVVTFLVALSISGFLLFAHFVY